MENRLESPGQRRRIRPERPTRDLVLALVYVVAGLIIGFAAIFPPTDVAPRTEFALLATASILGGLLLLAQRGPSPMWVLRIYLVVGIIGISTLISTVNSELGTTIAIVPCIWFSVYFGAYLQPREARLLIAMLCAGFGAGLIVSDVPVSISVWVIFSGTIVIINEALLVSNNALRAQARQDPLTGLLNRRGLEESIDPILAIGERIGKPTSLALIDLDDFKQLNDSLGHVAGDRVLIELAVTWTAGIRDTDLLVRFGGDEFILVMPTTDAPEARALIRRLGAADPVPWSFGIVEVESGEGLASALDRADRALYAAKGSGDGTLAGVMSDS